MVFERIEFICLRTHNKFSLITARTLTDNCLINELISCFNIVVFDVHIQIIYIHDMTLKLLSRVQLFATPWTVAHQAPLSMEFSRQEYWSGLPFPSPGDLPDPGIEPRSPAL